MNILKGVNFCICTCKDWSKIILFFIFVTCLSLYFPPTTTSLLCMRSIQNNWWFQGGREGGVDDWLIGFIFHCISAKPSSVDVNLHKRGGGNTLTDKKEEMTHLHELWMRKLVQVEKELSVNAFKSLLRCARCATHSFQSLNLSDFQRRMKGGGNIFAFSGSFMSCLKYLVILFRVLALRSYIQNAHHNPPPLPIL